MLYFSEYISEKIYTVLWNPSNVLAVTVHLPLSICFRNSVLLRLSPNPSLSSSFILLYYLLS